AANWLRAAVDAIAERALQAGRPLSAKKLEIFVKERRHAPEARRLAYEWLVKVDAHAPDRLLPRMLDDPSTELRRDAVARAIKEAPAVGGKKDATAAFRQVLRAARDQDQVESIAKSLKSLGVEVDLAAHFGFVRSWMLIGPFDNSNMAGFGKEFPPETRIDLAQSHPGKKDAVL